MKLISYRSTLALGLLSMITLAGCGSGDQPAPQLTGPGADTVISSVTLSSSGATAAFVPGKSLPSPSGNTANPSLTIPAAVTAAGGSMKVQAVAAVDDILVGVPGKPGYFDLKVSSAGGSRQTALPGPFLLDFTLTPTAPGVFTFSVQTVGDQGTSNITNINLSTTPDGIPELCGGGEATATFSDAAGSNADTSTFHANSAGGGYAPTATVVTEIGLATCTNDPLVPNSPRSINITLPTKLVAGQTYTFGGPTPGLNSTSYIDYKGYWISDTGTLTVQSISGDTVKFMVHAAMKPGPSPEVAPNRALGTFTLDVTGTVGVAGL